MVHRNIKDRDIVMFSFMPWDSSIAFNFREMAVELARYNRVLFIDRATDRNTKLRILLKGGKNPSPKQQRLEEVQKNLWILRPGSTLESANWSPAFRIFDFLNRINNRRLAKEIKLGIRQLGFQQSLFINDNDFFRGLYMKSLLPVSEYIFYLRDFLTVQPYFKKFGPRCEMEMILKADVVVTNSAYLADHAGQWNPFSFNIGQGFNMELFDGGEPTMPEDLRAIHLPVIGYCGAITAMRLDEKLLLQIADSFPEASLVLVGPTDEEFSNSMLWKKSNVHFIGIRTPAQVAAYIRHFTICINPQLHNALTTGNYPRKIDEYLAAGKPVIATATQAMKMFRDYVVLCTTQQEYIEGIKKMLTDSGRDAAAARDRRIAFARTHSWESSVAAIADALYYKSSGRMPVVI